MRKSTQWRKIGKSNWYRRYNADGEIVKTQLSKAAAKTRNKIIVSRRAPAKLKAKTKIIAMPFLDFFDFNREIEKAVFTFLDWRFDVNSLTELWAKMRLIIKLLYEVEEIASIIYDDDNPDIPLAELTIFYKRIKYNQITERDEITTVYSIK